MVMGGPGSGKSTTARLLADRLDLPVVHIDPMYWAPGWVARPRDETDRLARAAAAAEHWVFDGNHLRSADDRAARADLIVFLDLPLPVRLWRVFRRVACHRGETRPDMAEGCVEQWPDATFLRFILGYGCDGRLRTRAFLDRWGDRVAVARLRSQRAVRAFLGDPGAHVVGPQGGR